MGEDGRDQPGDLDVACAPGAGAGEGRISFEPAQGVGDRALLCLLNLGGDLR